MDNEEFEGFTILSGYPHALGLVAYFMERARWDAVWCCEWLKTGSIGQIQNKDVTAIATFFTQVSAASPAAPALAGKFEAILPDYRDMMVSTPGTGPGGEQVTFKEGEIWTIKGLEGLAKRLAALCVELENPPFRRK